MSEDAELFRRRVRASLIRNRETFEKSSEYRKMLDGLLGLSEEEIRGVLPAGTPKDDYLNLISVVKEATRVNVNQAELKARIEYLGETSLALAMKVPQLAKLFI